MTANVQQKRLLVIGLMGLLVVSVGGLFLAALQTTPLPMNLADAAQFSDLPEQAQPFSVGATDLSQPTHPFGLGVDENGALVTAVPGQEPLYTYQEAYSNGAYLPAGVAIGNFLYRYPSPAQAQQAADLYATLLQDNATPLDSPMYTDANGTPGRAFKVVGDEGDFVYWFIGVKRDVVLLSMADGTNDANVKGIFDATVHHLRQK